MPQKHKPTIAFAAYSRAADPKMMELPASMAHASSSYACAEDRYFKCPHTTGIDGHKRSNSGWFLLVLELARQKLGKKNTPPPWQPPLPYGRHGVPRSRCRRTQQSANILHDKSMSLKLEDSIVFTIY